MSRLLSQLQKAAACCQVTRTTGWPSVFRLKVPTRPELWVVLNSRNWALVTSVVAM